MEQKFEKIEYRENRSRTSVLREASESFLANLPVLICGLVMVIAIAREMFVN